MTMKYFAHRLKLEGPAGYKLLNDQRPVDSNILLQTAQNKTSAGGLTLVEPRQLHLARTRPI